MSQISSICVFCASSSSVAPKFLDAAARFGELCADAGITVVFGGGRVGLMGTLADAALTAGGYVIGVIPEFLDEVEIAHRGATEIFITKDMHERKAKMAELADAFVILPGGIGTLEEFFEVMTWKQLGQIDKPIIIANLYSYWQPIIDLLDHMTEEAFLRPEHHSLVEVVNRVEMVLPALGILNSAK
ncbi:MAG: TIGR00730 family Rossman fold protein [Proteobacteria bacterium]|nr:TIGR00730 family Rossman fold protein [Pseudomonadota bacterium]